MVAGETVKYKDTVMHVKRHDDMHAVSMPRATVEVSNIPSSYRRDTLTMLFENAKRSGGGEIEKIDFVPESGRALITFKDSTGICQVL